MPVPTVGARLRLIAWGDKRDLFLPDEDASPLSGTADHAIQLLDEETGIDLLATGTTSLYTAAEDQIISYAIMEVTAYSGGAVTTSPKGGIGIASGEQDILYTQNFSTLIALGSVFTLIGSLRTIPAAAVVKLGMDTAGDGPSTMTGTLWVFGFKP